MISPEGLSVPALLDAAAEQDREAAAFPALAAQRGPAVPAAACLRSVAVAGGGPGGHGRGAAEWPMSGTKIQKGRLRQRIADELAAASVTEAPRLSRPAAQAESA